MPKERTPLVLSENFLSAARDSGYRNTVFALAELIDNSLEAGATQIRVSFSVGCVEGVTVCVTDNGAGMDPRDLQVCLSFGGSSRFNSRQGVGRFGVGLPNSSLSQARRVEVYTWRDTEVLGTYLDLDDQEILRTGTVPPIRYVELPIHVDASGFNSGTSIVWRHCDRIQLAQLNSLERQVAAGLGRLFRFSIRDGVCIEVNGARVVGFDPLFLCDDNGESLATKYGETLEYAFCGFDGKEARIAITFSELPVDLLHGLDPQEKRRRGIVGGAGVSFVRMNREIDYGWMLMGSKRKENYDDWWRCEIAFPSALDELFGVSYSKQGVRPTLQLSRTVGNDLENVARTLNNRVRQQFKRIKSTSSKSEAVAANHDKFLPFEPRSHARTEIKGASLVYSLTHEPLEHNAFFSVEFDREKIQIVLNDYHPFYSQIYQNLQKRRDASALQWIELILLSFARAHCAVVDATGAVDSFELRSLWSDALAVFLGD